MRWFIMFGYLLVATLSWAGGEFIGVGGSGVCGMEAAVFDGQAPYIAEIGNVGTDTDVIQVNTISLIIHHADGEEARPNILVASDAGAGPIFVSPHGLFQTTSLVRPHIADLGLPPILPNVAPVLPMQFVFTGNVIFNAFTDHATVSGTVDLGSIGDICRVLAVNPTTCTSGAPLALARAKVIRHARIRHFHHLKKHAHPITPIERARLEAALGHR